MEQAADKTEYTVWIAWNDETKNSVIARLGRVLNIGIPAAREKLETGAPIAEGVTAVKVSELIERYAKDGLKLRIEPEFTWEAR